MISKKRGIGCESFIWCHIILGNKENDDFRIGIMMIRIYITAIVLALINFIYIYIFKFDSLSEEKLVLYTPVWLLLFIFGIYGLQSSKLMKQVNEGKYQNMREALVQSSKSFGIFGPLRQIFFFPYLSVL